MYCMGNTLYYHYLLYTHNNIYLIKHIISSNTNIFSVYMCTT